MEISIRIRKNLKSKKISAYNSILQFPKKKFLKKFHLKIGGLSFSLYLEKETAPKNKAFFNKKKNFGGP